MEQCTNKLSGPTHFKFKKFKIALTKHSVLTAIAITRHSVLTASYPLAAVHVLTF